MACQAIAFLSQLHKKNHSKSHYYTFVLSFSLKESLKMKSLLPVSTLVHTYCADNDCENDASVASIFAVLREIIGSSCYVSNKNIDQVQRGQFFNLIIINALRTSIQMYIFTNILRCQFENMLIISYIKIFVKQLSKMMLHVSFIHI